MYCKEDGEFATCKNSDLIEELGQVEFIFSDKFEMKRLPAFKIFPSGKMPTPLRMWTLEEPFVNLGWI